MWTSGTLEICPFPQGNYVICIPSCSRCYRIGGDTALAGQWCWCILHFRVLQTCFICNIFSQQHSHSNGNPRYVYNLSCLYVHQTTNIWSIGNRTKKQRIFLDPNPCTLQGRKIKNWQPESNHNCRITEAYYCPKLFFNPSIKSTLLLYMEFSFFYHS